MKWLDTSAGHIAVCLLLLLWASALASVAAYPRSDEIVIFALGVLSRSMIGTSGGKGSGDPSANKDAQ